MPQSLYVLTTHIIFSTKSRQRCLTGTIRPRLWAYMARTLENLGCHSVLVGGVEDHVHVLCDLTKSVAPMKVIEILKKDSSKFIKTLDRPSWGFIGRMGMGCLA